MVKRRRTTTGWYSCNTNLPGPSQPGFRDISDDNRSLVNHHTVERRRTTTTGWNICNTKLPDPSQPGVDVEKEDQRPEKRLCVAHHSLRRDCCFYRRLSHILSKILRHTSSSLRKDGFICVHQLIATEPKLRSLNCRIVDLEKVVYNNSKNRFEIRQDLTSGETLIRARQGHSLKGVHDEETLERLSLNTADLPSVCVHGTYRDYIESIKKQGLRPGGDHSNRTHVHFAPFEPGDGRVISGMRQDCQVAVYISLRRALQGGLKFYRSTNNVILTPDVVPPLYFDKVRLLDKSRRGERAAMIPKT